MTDPEMQRKHEAYGREMSKLVRLWQAKQFNKALEEWRRLGPGTQEGVAFALVVLVAKQWTDDEQPQLN
jgi:hypothetical protein